MYERFDTREGFQAAVERLLEQPGRELRIFDPDGAALRLNDAARIARLERFLRASRTRRLYLVLHEHRAPSARLPAHDEPARALRHAIQINRTHEEIRELQDAFLVLDSLALRAPAGGGLLPRRDRARRRDRGARDAGALQGDLGRLLPGGFQHDGRPLTVEPVPWRDEISYGAA